MGTPSKSPPCPTKDHVNIFLCFISLIKWWFDMRNKFTCKEEDIKRRFKQIDELIKDTEKEDNRMKECQRDAPVPHMVEQYAKYLKNYECGTENLRKHLKELEKQIQVYEKILKGEENSLPFQKRVIYVSLLLLALSLLIAVKVQLYIAVCIMGICLYVFLRYYCNIQHTVDAKVFYAVCGQKYLIKNIWVSDFEKGLKYNQKFDIS